LRKKTKVPDFSTAAQGRKLGRKPLHVREGKKVGLDTELF
jgi:hypothetical protein